jgi:transmembrane sensor
MPPEIIDLALARAIELWTRQHSGTPWTAADEARLQAWLDAAPQHRAAYERVARAWDAAGALGGLVQRAPVARRRPGLSRSVAAACAALLLVAIFAPGLTSYREGRGVVVSGSTHPGERKTLTLEDGTEVLLDASSELVAQIGARSRHVWLKHGEALFTVRHDATRPFEVEAAGSQIRDLGTRFDVEILRDGAHVAVLQGRVEVLTRRGHVSLGAGSAGGYHTTGDLLPVRMIRTATLPSPQQRFDSEPLAQVLERLARYHGVTFVYTDSSLQELRVSGSFNIDDLAAFLRTLSVALPLETRFVAPQQIEVSRRAATPAATSPGAAAPSPGKRQGEQR